MSWKYVQRNDETGAYRTTSEGGGGGGGSSTLAGLDDVDLNSLQDGQIIKWDATNQKFVNVNSGYHIYSTTEQIVGKWHNGKTLYEKTVEFNNVSNSGDASFGIANVETIFLISGMSSAGNPLPYVHGAAPAVNVGGFFTITAQDTFWSFRCGSSAPSTLSGFLVVRYTKTTDPTPS